MPVSIVAIAIFSVAAG